MLVVHGERDWYLIRKTFIFYILILPKKSMTKKGFKLIV